MSSSEEKTVPAFGYEIIRDYLMPTILGKHESDILYWAGKDLARKFPCSDTQLIISFFKDAGWGTLSLKKELKDGVILHITGDAELMNIENRSFRLEAGFVAEQIQSIKGCLTECFDEKNEKQQCVILNVKWDPKEKIEK